MVSRRGSENKIVSTIGALLHILLVAIPKDLWRWLNLRKKSVRDQVVVITGAASGLGQRMAEIFALELGAKVAVVDIDEVRAFRNICEKQMKKTYSMLTLIALFHCYFTQRFLLFLDFFTFCRKRRLKWRMTFALEAESHKRGAVTCRVRTP